VTSYTVKLLHSVRWKTSESISLVLSYLGVVGEVFHRFYAQLLKTALVEIPRQEVSHRRTSISTSRFVEIRRFGRSESFIESTNYNKLLRTSATFPQECTTATCLKVSDFLVVGEAIA
jgi:Zn-dependent M32 family carboxypeptidase